jgi:hypothetical protein
MHTSALAPLLAALSIDHRSTSCVVPERHPVLRATVSPAGDIVRARVVFRAAGTPHWYAVDMQTEGAELRGTLPQPLKTTTGIEYYIEAADRSLAESRTPQHEAKVAPDCPSDMNRMSVTSAAITVLRLAGTAAELPAGFSGVGLVSGGVAAGTTAAAAGATTAGGGGLSTPALIGIIGGAGAVAGGAAVTLSSGDAAATWSGTATLAAPDPRSCSVAFDLTLELQESGTEISGTSIMTSTSSSGTAPGCIPAGNTQTSKISGRIEGGNVEWSPTNGPSFTFLGTRTGTSMAGTWSTLQGQLLLSGPWNATRR